MSIAEQRAVGFIPAWSLAFLQYLFGYSYWFFKSFWVISASELSVHSKVSAILHILLFFRVFGGIDSFRVLVS